MKSIKFKQWECNPVFGEYGNGRTAIQLKDAVDGSPIATATINLCDYPEFPIGEGQVHIKNYSENEGMVAALIEAGIVEEISSFGIGPFAAPCSLCKLIGAPE